MGFGCQGRAVQFPLVHLEDEERPDRDDMQPGLRISKSMSGDTDVRTS